jgi:hypothetical protein
MREIDTQGTGEDRKDCTRQFRVAGTCSARIPLG